MMVLIAYQKLFFFIVADTSFLMKMVIVRTHKTVFITAISFYLYLCNRFLLPRKRMKIEK